MRVVVDALAALDRSHSVVVERLLEAWVELAPEDELHLAITDRSELVVPPSVTAHVSAARGRAQRVLLQSTALPRLCREVRADALFATLPASSVVRTSCPRASWVFDFRHELRPEQFSLQHRLLRRVSYGRGYRLSAALVCDSERTATDLRELHPDIAPERVSVALLGADHALAWQPGGTAGPAYALAFGQWNNKNADAVVAAWAHLPEAPRLALVGMSAQDRERLGEQVAVLGLQTRVDLLPWLPPEEFAATFAGASLVVFPSDFEGFGLPAAEALALGIPLVISTDPALLEVTAGHAAVASTTSPVDIAAAVREALSTDRREAGQGWAEQLTWRRTAEGVRAAVQRAASG